MRKSCRLTKSEKAGILAKAKEYGEHLFPTTDSFLDPNESSEFNEGMAAGLTLALTTIQEAEASEFPSENKIQAEAAIVIVAARCINYIK